MSPAAGVHRSAYLANYSYASVDPRRPDDHDHQDQREPNWWQHSRARPKCLQVLADSGARPPCFPRGTDMTLKGGPCIGTCHESGRGSAELCKLCIGPQHAPRHSSSASRQTVSATCRTASRTSMPHCMGNLAKPTKPLSPRVVHQALHGLKLHSGRHLGPVHLLVAGLAHVVVAAGFRASVGSAADSTHVASAAHDTC